MSVAARTVSTPDRVRISRALISVSDKTGIVELARWLASEEVEIVSTGGTASQLREEGIAVRDVSEITGFPEIMDGRVKTLHPAVHGAILAIRDLEDHDRAMQDHAITPIDLVVVNLYPFEATLASGAAYADCIENIDIGGPAMLRAAAKNHAYVTIITDPADYSMLTGAETSGRAETGFAFRKKMAAKAFAHVASYDASVAAWFASETGDPLPERICLAGKRAEALRYGENPHQKAAFYRDSTGRAGVASATQLQGKQLSYNNINDTDAAFELVSEFAASEPAVAIIKHANPCGVATGPTLSEAYQRALACDPVSAFGGIVAFNARLDAEAARQVVGIFTEVIIAPEVDEEARAVIAAKPNLRLLVTGSLADPAAGGLSFKSVAGGLLVQSRDNGIVGTDDLRIVTRRAPTSAELTDLLFAFRVAKHVKSNAIVYARNGATVGIGAGQMSRVDSARIAARKAMDAAEAQGLAEPLTRGSVVASDAFFPFADGLLSAIEAGATAVIQPGGSMRDDEVIAAADSAGIAMVLTGMRHFRH